MVFHVLYSGSQREGGLGQTRDRRRLSTSGLKWHDGKVVGEGRDGAEFGVPARETELSRGPMWWAGAAPHRTSGCAGAPCMGRGVSAAAAG